MIYIQNAINSISYVLDGSNIIKETRSGSQTATLYYYYDNSGVTGFQYGGNYYYYGKNLQGDITKVYDWSGVEVASYTYDAWGNIITATGTMAQINPFRYRGYYYDSETGWYYLNSRYYDPSVGRFINADEIMGVNDDMATYNLYAYCGNNPVNRYDDGGMFWKELWEGVKDAVETVLDTGNTVAIAIGFDTAAIGAAVLDMEKDSSGVYHAKTDCWQQYFGYNDLYDFFFDVGTDMEKAEFVFSYNGSDYTIWAWKGDYINLGIGAELGIYCGSSGHRTVDTSLAMQMGIVMSYERQIIIDYRPSENQWWITAFNPDPRYQDLSVSNLAVSIKVGFNSSGMYSAFKYQWGGDSRWTFYDSCNIAVLRF